MVRVGRVGLVGSTEYSGPNGVHEHQEDRSPDERKVFGSQPCRPPAVAEGLSGLHIATCVQACSQYNEEKGQPGQHTVQDWHCLERKEGSQKAGYQRQYDEK